VADLPVSQAGYGPHFPSSKVKRKKEKEKNCIPAILIIFMI
jgi:hypothetical protein